MAQEIFLTILERKNTEYNQRAAYFIAYVGQAVCVVQLLSASGFSDLWTI